MKNVPADATVVGIPGHVVTTKKEKQLAHREAIANKMGFDAYGATADMPDPVAYALHHMLDHIHLMDEQLETMKQVIKNSGIELQEAPIPELTDCEIETGDDGTAS